MNSQRGFTLLETLVALGVLAVALAAILRLAAVETQHAETLRLKLLADWVAQDRLVLHTAQGSWLEVGEQRGEITQANVPFMWHETISATPNPAFRRIDIRVYLPENQQYALREVSGFLVRERRQ